MDTVRKTAAGRQGANLLGRGQHAGGVTGAERPRELRQVDFEQAGGVGAVVKGLTGQYLGAVDQVLALRQGLPAQQVDRQPFDAQPDPQTWIDVGRRVEQDECPVDQAGEFVENGQAAADHDGFAYQFHAQNGVAFGREGPFEGQPQIVYPGQGVYGLHL